MLTVTNCIFRKGTADDVPHVIDLIRQRIEWMDDMGIDQWNNTHYLEHYPSRYYMDAAEKGQLYVLDGKDNNITASAVLLTADNRWMLTNANAFYVHNLVSAIGEGGSGKVLLQFIEDHACSQHKQLVRLDCAIDNEKLNQWYERQGYRYVGTMVEDEYRGCLREKEL